MSNLTRSQAPGLSIGQQNEELYGRLLAISPDAMMVTGLDTVLLACNAEAASMLGYGCPSELAGKSALEFIAPEDHERAMHNMRDTLDVGSVRGLEYTLVRKDGVRIPVQLSASLVLDDTGEPGQFVMTLRDLTAWKRAESERLAEEARRQAEVMRVESQPPLLQTIFDSAPVALAYFDREMRFIDFNSEYAQISPPDIPIVRGRVIYDLNPAAREREAIHRRVLAGEPVDEENVRYEYPNGDVRYRDLRYRPVRDADGEVIGVVSSAVDVTARQEMARQKDEFLALASHELKTPITSIKGFAQIAARAAGKLGDEKLSHMLTIINEQSDRLSRLIDDLNDVSRARVGALKLYEEPFDLRDLVRDAVDSLHLTAPDFAFPMDLPDSPITVNADRQRIEQVVTNLVDNAVKYSGVSRVVEIAVRPEGDEVIVAVRDYGVGIPADQQAQVFELFFRSSNVESKQYSGLGLGLFISRGIIARHGGRTWFESAERAGSTFYFSLPLGLT
jgi:PAS domain S-box-containing protein